MSDVLAFAHRFAALGLSVIPVHRPVGDGRDNDGKIPALSWTRFQRERATPAQLDAWFVRPMNIGLVTGAVSGIVVIDGDSLAACRWIVRHLPYTPWQTKTAKGYHLFYRHPGGRVPNRARIETSDGKLAIDVRGDGGYVIAAGSLHVSGAHYELAGDWDAPRERVPNFWSGWLRKPTPRPTSAPTRRATPTPIRSAADVRTRAARYLDAIPRPEIGAGSDCAVLSAACRLVRGFGLSAADAEDLLWSWVSGGPGWTRDWIAQKVANAERYGSEPIGGLRDESAS